MTGTYFETFMVGGLGLLVAAGLAIAWLLWRETDTRREAIKLSLEGIGHEFRFNMFQTVRELRDVTDGLIRTPEDLPRLAHPQLDAVLAQVMATDKRALAAIQATYQNIEGAKRRLRMKLAAHEAIDDVLDEAKLAAVDGISTLYLWEDHEGRPPARARSTRSWWVRDWMKAHGFEQALLPGLALRDAVVENLRQSGMVLTPRPLTLTAHAYYSRNYSRLDDPRGVFGKRRQPKVEDEADTPEEDEVVLVAETEVPSPAPLAAVAATGAIATASAADSRADAAEGTEPEDPFAVSGPETEPEMDEASEDEGVAFEHAPTSREPDYALPEQANADPFPNEEELRSAERGQNPDLEEPDRRKTVDAAE